MKRIYFIIILLFVSNLMLFAQDYSTKYNTRTIVLNYPDSVLKIQILNSQEDFKIQDHLKYYWYNDNTIGYNRGGINGTPLHGIYKACNKEGILLTKGEFRHGLKEGKWKIWYTSGELKAIENYKNGLKDNIQTYYSENGEIVKEVKYKKGVEIEKKETSFLKSLFKKKEKEEKMVNDSIQNEDEISNEDTDI